MGGNSLNSRPPNVAQLFNEAAAAAEDGKAEFMKIHVPIVPRDREGTSLRKKGSMSWEGAD